MCNAFMGGPSYMMTSDLILNGRDFKFIIHYFHFGSSYLPHPFSILVPTYAVESKSDLQCLPSSRSRADFKVRVTLIPRFHEAAFSHEYSVAVQCLMRDSTAQCTVCNLNLEKINSSRLPVKESFKKNNYPR